MKKNLYSIIVLLICLVYVDATNRLKIKISADVNLYDDNNTVYSGDIEGAAKNFDTGENMAGCIVTDEKYIENSAYFRANPKHAENNTVDNSFGTCTTVAFQLLLGYHNYYTDRRIIPTFYEKNDDGSIITQRFLSANYGKIENNPIICPSNSTKSEEIGTEDTVYRELINLNPGASTIGYGQLLPTVFSATERFIDKYSLNCKNYISFQWNYFNQENVIEEIDRGRPVVLQMRKYITGGKTYHTVVAYGYATVNNEFGFITHFGWRTDQNLRMWVHASYFHWQATFSSTHIHNYSNNYTYYQDLYKISTCTTCGYKKVEYLYDFEVENIDDNEYITIKKVSEQIPNQLTIPEIINGTIVKTIDNNAFKDNILLEEITIPSSVTKIGDSVFENCIKLRKVTYLGNDVTIGKYSFKNCDKLSDINLLAKLKQINEGTFEECNSLETVILSSELTKIDKYAFRNCASLGAITVPTNVKTIPIGAFEGCNNLVRVSLPSSLISIEYNAFKDCTSLKRMIVPYQVNNISQSAFENCKNLTSITIPNAVTVIEENVFSGCENLETIEFPNNLSVIKAKAFLNCYNLKITSFPTNIQEIGTFAFKNCRSIENVILPKGLLLIKEEAFAGCTKLNQITLLRETNGVINIENGIFDNCIALTKIVIPSSQIIKYSTNASWSLYKDKFVLSNELSEYSLNCYSSPYTISTTLEHAHNKLYKINIKCNKSYKITVNANYLVNIHLYHENMNEIDLTSFITDTADGSIITIYLGTGIYYLDVSFARVDSYGNVTITSKPTWQVNYYDVEMGINNISEHLHNDGNMLKTHLKLSSVGNAGFYNITISDINVSDFDSLCFEGMMMIYDEEGYLFNKYIGTEIYDQAFNRDGANNIVLFIPVGTTIKIEIVLPQYNYSGLKLEISKVGISTTDLFNVIEDTNSVIVNYGNVSLGDKITQIDLKQAAKFRLDTHNLTEGYFVIFNTIKPFDEQEQLRIVLKENITQDFTIDFTLLEGRYYIGYIGSNTSSEISFTITRLVTEYGSENLLPDLDGVGYYGTEVVLNGGMTSSNIITNGFTRLIYLLNGDSRLDYYWYSSDESVIRITDYGTVLGLSNNEDLTAKVMAVNKNDPTKVYIKEFIVVRDQLSYENDKIIINTTMTIDSNSIVPTQIDLSNVIVPINWIQYYEWNANTSYIQIDNYGRIIVDKRAAGNSYSITGYYTLNARVEIRIIIVVE